MPNNDAVIGAISVEITVEINVTVVLAPLTNGITTSKVFIPILSNNNNNVIVTDYTKNFYFYKIELN